MSYSSTDTSLSHNNKMEGKDMGARHTKCKRYLPIKNNNVNVITKNRLIRLWIKESIKSNGIITIGSSKTLNSIKHRASYQHK